RGGDQNRPGSLWPDLHGQLGTRGDPFDRPPDAWPRAGLARGRVAGDPRHREQSRRRRRPDGVPGGARTIGCPRSRAERDGRSLSGAPRPGRRDRRRLDLIEPAAGGTGMVARRLDQLLEASDLDRLLSAAASLAPDVRITVANADGRVIASAGAPARDAEAAARHPIVADDRTVGSVVVEGGPAADRDRYVPDANAIAAVVALACSLAAGPAGAAGLADDAASSDVRRQLDAELAIGRRIQLSL